MKKLVRIKSWNEMLEKYLLKGDYIIDNSLDDDYEFTIVMEQALPEDRIIELDEDMLWQDWGFSDWMIADYIDETKSEQITPQDVVAEYIADINIPVDLDSPEHPANQPLLPELDEFKGSEVVKEVLELLDDEFNLKQIKSDNFKLLKTLRKSASRVHYYKFPLNFSEDYSLRFFLQFEDRREYEGQFVLKSHSKRESSIITRSMAEDLIGKLCEIPCEEIIGRRCGKNYEKIVISENKLVRFTE
jgi:hypothetical protein